MHDEHDQHRHFGTHAVRTARAGTSGVDTLLEERWAAVGVAGLLCACDVLELGMAQLEALDGPEGES